MANREPVPIQIGGLVASKVTVTDSSCRLMSGTNTNAEIAAAIVASHAALTLATSANVLLGLSTQELSLDTQAANAVFVGPTSGIAAAPTFRSMVAADLGTTLTPTFAGIVIGDAGTIGLGTSKGLIQFDDETTDFVSFLNCNVGIGTSTPGALLHIHAASGSNPAFRLTDADVSHPFTAVGFNPEITADTLTQFGVYSGTIGGLVINGFSDTDGVPIAISGNIGSASPTVSAIELSAFKTNGTTGRTALAGNEYVLDVRTGSTLIMRLTANGKLAVGDNISGVPGECLQVKSSAHAGALFERGSSTDSCYNSFRTTTPLVDNWIFGMRVYKSTNDFAIGNNAAEAILIQESTRCVVISGDTPITNYELTVYDDIWAVGTVSGLTITDRTPAYTGEDPIADIKQIKAGEDGNIDHESMPEFLKVYARENIMEDRVIEIPERFGVGKGKTRVEKVKVGERDIIQRNLGNAISLLVSAVQVLIDRVEKLETAK